MGTCHILFFWFEYKPYYRHTNSVNYDNFFTAKLNLLYSFLIFFLLAEQITVIGKEMCVDTSSFAHVWSQIKQMSVIFTHLKLWVAPATRNVKCVKIEIL